MYCYNCGKQIEDDSNFCPFCGIKVIDLKTIKLLTSKENKDTKSIDTTPNASNVGDRLVSDFSDLSSEWEMSMKNTKEKVNEEQRFFENDGKNIHENLSSEWDAVINGKI